MAPNAGGHLAAAWPTYGRDFARTGVATGVAPAGGSGSLHVSWRASLDGAVYGQPLLVGTTVIAATENDSLYALDASTGQVRWRTHVGTPVPLADLPCGDIDPLGITGTPVYDGGNGLVYAVAETSGYHHVLVGVSAATGAVTVERDIPTPDGQPRYDQQRPGLAIEDGRVYVAFGGLYGDCGPYRGSVVGVPLSGTGSAVSYLVPTAREGAVWGTAGPVIGPDGTLYVSVGNGSTSSTAFDGSDSVTALSPALRQVGIFAPSTWYTDSQHDLDLGSTQPALLASGMLLALGKSGTAYLISAAHPGGVGGQVAQAGRLPGLRRGRRGGQHRVRALRAGRHGRDQHRGRQAPRAVARAGQRLGLPGRRRRGGLGHRLERWHAVRARPGHRRDPVLAAPGHVPAALRVDVDDGQPRLPRHHGRRAGSHWRLTMVDHVRLRAWRERVAGPFGIKGLARSWPRRSGGAGRLGPWPLRRTSNHRCPRSSSTWTGR